MGNPNILAISAGFCEGPCSASSGVTDTALAYTVASADVAELSPAWAAMAQSAPRQTTAAAKSDISLVFKSSTWPNQWAHFDTFHSPVLACAQLSVASSDKRGSQFRHALALEARCRQRSLVQFEGAVVARE
jgi:hypothetical protein